MYNTIQIDSEEDLLGHETTKSSKGLLVYRFYLGFSATFSFLSFVILAIVAYRVLGALDMLNQIESLDDVIQSISETIDAKIVTYEDIVNEKFTDSLQLANEIKKCACSGL